MRWPLLVKMFERSWVLFDVKLVRLGAHLEALPLQCKSPIWHHRHNFPAILAGHFEVEVRFPPSQTNPLFTNADVRAWKQTLSGWF